MNRINPDTINFLNELKKNNNRDWFQANRDRYQKIREDFISFLEHLYPSLVDNDPTLKGIDVRKSVFRINRDVRFSEDKSPYKTTIASVLIEGGKRNFSEIAGYYIHIEPGASLVAGGAYLPPSPWITAIRREISSDGQTFRNIIDKPSFKELFGGLTGDKLKSAPKGFPKDHPEIELLRYKSFLAMQQLDNKLVLSDQFAEVIINAAREIRPLNDFVNSAR